MHEFISNIINFDNQQAGKYARYVNKLKGMKS